MRSSRWAGAVVAIALLTSAGCWWGQPGAGPGNTFANFDQDLTVGNVATLEQVWSGRGALSAVVDGKVIGAYWTGSGVDVVAHDFGTGAEVWSHTLSPPGAVSGFPTHQPVVSGAGVWVGHLARTAAGTCAFGLSRFDLATGALLGTDTGFAPGELVPFDHRVALVSRTYAPGFGDTCMPSLDSPLRVADGATGTTEWTASGFSSSQAITQVGDRIYGTSGSVLRSYPSAGCGAATCAPITQTQPAGVGALNDLAGESSGPFFAIAPGGVPNQLWLYAIDPATGSSLGSTLLGFHATTLALADGTVFVAGDTTLAAYDVASCAAGSCALEWSAPLGGQVTWANGLAIAGGVVYVGRGDGVVEAFAAAGCDAATCSSLTSVSTGGEVLQLVVAQGRLFVGSTDDTVTAFAPAA
jgi:hypothetical protein